VRAPLVAVVTYTSYVTASFPKKKRDAKVFADTGSEAGVSVRHKSLRKAMPPKDFSHEEIGIAQSSKFVKRGGKMHHFGQSAHKHNDGGVASCSAGQVGDNVH